MALFKAIFHLLESQRNTNVSIPKPAKCCRLPSINVPIALKHCVSKIIEMRLTLFLNLIVFVVSHTFYIQIMLEQFDERLCDSTHYVINGNDFAKIFSTLKNIMSQHRLMNFTISQIWGRQTSRFYYYFIDRQNNLIKCKLRISATVFNIKINS